MSYEYFLRSTAVDYVTLLFFLNRLVNNAYLPKPM